MNLLLDSWDEWVSADRLLKHTEENLVKQKALDKKQGVEKGAKSGRSAQTKTRSSAGEFVNMILRGNIHFILGLTFIDVSFSS